MSPLIDGRMCDDLLDRELFYNVAKVLVESRLLEYNDHRPHSGLGYMIPAAFVVTCIASVSLTAQLRQYTMHKVDNFLISAGI